MWCTRTGGLAGRLWRGPNRLSSHALKVVSDRDQCYSRNALSSLVRQMAGDVVHQNRRARRKIVERAKSPFEPRPESRIRSESMLYAERLEFLGSPDGGRCGAPEPAGSQEDCGEGQIAFRATP